MKSSKPSKQRLVTYLGGSHKIRKLMSSPLSAELRESFKRRSYPVRKGDVVKIRRGDFSGIEGKVTKVDTEKRRLFIEGVTREKVAGKSVNVSVHATKVMITKLNLDDKWRSESIKLSSEDKARSEA